MCASRPNVQPSFTEQQKRWHFQSRSGIINLMLLCKLAVFEKDAAKIWSIKWLGNVFRESGLLLQDVDAGHRLPLLPYGDENKVCCICFWRANSVAHYKQRRRSNKRCSFEQRSLKQWLASIMYALTVCYYELGICCHVGYETEFVIMVKTIDTSSLAVRDDQWSN